MKLLKESFKLYKKKFFYVLIADLVFIILTVLSIILIRIKLNYIINEVYELGASGDEQLLLLNVDKIEPLLREFGFYLYFLLPSIIIIIFTLTQGFLYQMLRKDKIKEIRLKEFVKLLVISLPFYLFLIFFVVKSFLLFSFIISPELVSASEEQIINLPKEVIISGILTLIFGYLAFVGYSYIGLEIKEMIRKIFKISIKKIHILFPLFLVFIAISSGLIFSGFGAFILYLTGENGLISLIVAIVLLILSQLFRVLFFEIEKKY